MMSTKSRFLYHRSNSSGLGLAVHRIQHEPVRRIDSGASAPAPSEPAPTYTPQPITTPATTDPVITEKATGQTEVIPAGNELGDSFSLADLLRIEGDRIVINRQYEIDKRTAYIAGGGFVGAAVLATLLR